MKRRLEEIRALHSSSFLKITCFSPTWRLTSAGRRPTARQKNDPEAGKLISVDGVKDKSQPPAAEFGEITPSCKQICHLNLGERIEA